MLMVYIFFQRVESRREHVTTTTSGGIGVVESAYGGVVST